MNARQEAVAAMFTGRAAVLKADAESATLDKQIELERLKQENLARKIIQISRINDLMPMDMLQAMIEAAEDALGLEQSARTIFRQRNV